MKRPPDGGMLLSKFLKRFLKGGRQRRAKAHPFPGCRMCKREAVCVQHEPRNTDWGFQLRRIDLVAQQRMADGEHVDADLVGTPGEQMHIQISRAA